MEDLIRYKEWYIDISEDEDSAEEPEYKAEILSLEEEHLDTVYFCESTDVALEEAINWIETFYIAGKTFADLRKENEEV